MEFQSWTEDEAPEPMLQEQFELALSNTHIRVPQLIAACRFVLVEGMSAKEAIARVAQATTDAPSAGYVDQGTLSRAVNTVREKWYQILAEEGWEEAPFAFPPQIMTVLKVFQKDAIDRVHARKESQDAGDSSSIKVDPPEGASDS